MIELSSREVAIVIWLLAFGVYVGRDKAVRTSFLHVLRAATDPALVRIWIVISAYVSLVVFLLSRFNLWTVDNLKTTIVWFFVFAVSSVMELNRVTADRTYFKRAILDLISLTVVFEFLSELATFSLPVELALVPIVTLVVLMLAVAQSQKDPKFIPVVRLLEWLQVALGTLLIVRVVWWLWANYAHLTTPETIREFSVPIFLTISYLPVISALSVAAGLQMNHLVLRRSLKDPVLYTYARNRSFLAFGLNVKKLRRWVRHVGLFGCHSRQEVDASIARVKGILAREKSPFDVPAEEGWRPDKAAHFLAATELVVENYRESPLDWFGMSNYKNLDDGILPNNMTYQLEGEEGIVRKLEILLNVNEPDGSESAVAEFNLLCQKLYRSAMNSEPDKGFMELLSNSHGEITVEATRILLTRRDWPNGSVKGFELSMQFIRTKSAK